MNRFFDIDGDVSTQLAPWVLKELGLPLDIAQYRLEKQLRMRSDIAGGVIVIQPTRISDLASIPRLIWPIMHPADPRIALATWFHDEIYKRRGVLILECGKTVKLTRKQGDQILCFEGMPDLHAEKWRQDGVYQALRRFGHQWEGNSIFERLT